MIQSATALFVDVKHEDIAQIDIIFRTAISSIFGYIMSMVSTADFALKNKSVQNTPSPPKSIGFSSEEKDIPKAISLEESGANTVAELLTIDQPLSISGEKKLFKANVQIIVLTSVCLFCLITLLVVRNFSEHMVANTTNGVTISQYRDIVSGSIGALIGLSRSNN